MNLSRHQVLKLLLDQQVYDSIPENYIIKPNKPNNYYSMYDILEVLGIEREELDYIDRFNFKDL